MWRKRLRKGNTLSSPSYNNPKFANAHTYPLQTMVTIPAYATETYKEAVVCKERQYN